MKWNKKNSINGSHTDENKTIIGLKYSIRIALLTSGWDENKTIIGLKSYSNDVEELKLARWK